MFINRIQESIILRKYNRIGAVPQFRGATIGEQISTGDVFERSSNVSNPVDENNKTEKTKRNSSVAKARKVKSPEKVNNSKTLKKLDIIKNEKLLTDEVMYFLNPKDEKTFTVSQARVIDAAFDKLVFFKEISMQLAEDAQKYGPEIREQIKEIFGGEEGFGTDDIVNLRMKDEVSVFNKLVKEFKNDHIKNEAHNIFSKKLYGKPYALLDKDEKGLVKLSIEDGEVKLDAKDFKLIENAIKTNPKNELAHRLYLKPYQQLSNEERKKISEVYESRPELVSTATKIQERKEAIDWVRDLVGIRLVLPTGSRAELAKVEKYIDKAVGTGDMKITRFSNYHGSHILPYIKKEKARYWKEQIPGMVLVENNQVRKKNGYTTTQMNLDQYVDGHKKPIYVELQIRTKALNEIGNREHLIYDILEGKDITKGIPELKTFFDSIGIVKAVNDVFGDPKQEEKYSDYERAYYSYLRNNENEKRFHEVPKPLLTQFGLGQYEYLLSFEALEGINNKAKDIKDKYGKKETKSSKEKLEYLRKLQ